MTEQGGAGEESQGVVTMEKYGYIRRNFMTEDIYEIVNEDNSYHVFTFGTEEDLDSLLGTKWDTNSTVVVDKNGYHLEVIYAEDAQD